MVYFLCFRLEIPFLGKFGPKNKNCLFKLKFGTRTNSDMQNLLMMFTFQFMNGNTFLGKFVEKKNHCQFKLKFGTQTNLNLCNSVVVFTFSVFDWKYTLRANFILHAEAWYQKSEIWRIHKMFTFFPIFTSYSFWVNLVQKVKIVSLIRNLVPWLIQTCRIQ